MPRGHGAACLILVQLDAGCAGQGQFGGGEAFQLPVASPPPMAPAYAPPPAYGAPPPYSPPPAYAQTCIHPQRGQSPQQEESDRGQCYGWAVQQTGFDPANPQVATPPAPPMYAPPSQQSPATGALEYGAGGRRCRANYDRAFGACMSARGYSVN